MANSGECDRETARLVQKQTDIAKKLVPWLHENIDPAFFSELPEDLRAGLMHTMCAHFDDTSGAFKTTAGRTMHKTEVGNQYQIAFLEFGASGVAVLENQVRSLPQEYGYLLKARCYSAKDCSLCVTVYVLGEGTSEVPPNLQDLYDQVDGKDDVGVKLVPNGDRYLAHVANTNVNPQEILTRTIHHLQNHHLETNHVSVDVVIKPDHMCTLSTFSISSPQKVDHFERELKRLKWADKLTLKVASTVVESRKIGLARAEIITCLFALVNPILSRANREVFSRGNVITVLQDHRHLKLGIEIADAFLTKFHFKHGGSKEKCQDILDKVRASIPKEPKDFVAACVLDTMVQGVECTYRTNYFMENRYALSLRVDPKIFFQPFKFSTSEFFKSSEADSERIPFGLFFSYGRRFCAFHIRFRNIARGGLRLVTPMSGHLLNTQFGYHFDENWSLAFGQQLKNKDIPEGGAKCVVLCNVLDRKGDLLDIGSRSKIMRSAVKGFVDSLLDLLVVSPEYKERVVDYYGEQEFLYLGPDEQVIPEDINWIAQRAVQRNYTLGQAFISSKPTFGINHKEYGVTSEGVRVYADVAMRHVGLHPLEEGRTRPVTFKITGGPGGDVAGNMIKLLKKHYGDKAAVVGICDGTGSLEDPDGLNMDELLRLVHESKDVDQYDRTKLGPNGRLAVVPSDEGIWARNTMHNRVVSDVFLPCGGRPDTINDDNWEQFLQENGEPTSKLIVEGANVFLTPGARQALYERCKLPIIKDSSANKCGVICSSYEIMSCMLLTEEEFVSNKQQIVEDVLVRLRHLAQLEAELLFSEFKTRPGTLPSFSQGISDAINRMTDAVSEHLTRTGQHEDPNEPLVSPLVYNHLPGKLHELGASRMYQKVPVEYIKCIIASALASKIVYSQGVLFVQEAKNKNLSSLATNFIKNEDRIQHVLDVIQSADWKGDDAAREDLLTIVQGGGFHALQQDEF